tara:strand:- start:38 stop:418 length:381 start_codon:yes stop_codon:yes gene_type:complete
VRVVEKKELPGIVAAANTRRVQAADDIVVVLAYCHAMSSKSIHLFVILYSSLKVFLVFLVVFPRDLRVTVVALALKGNLTPVDHRFKRLTNEPSVPGKWHGVAEGGVCESGGRGDAGTRGRTETTT